VKGQTPSNAEKALQIENKILKQRLRTLKDNINILNSMIEHIKIDPNARKENRVKS
jgi:argininosuccinate lyase